MSNTATEAPRSSIARAAPFCPPGEVCQPVTIVRPGCNNPGERMTESGRCVILAPQQPFLCQAGQLQICDQSGICECVAVKPALVTGADALPFAAAVCIAALFK